MRREEVPQTMNHQYLNLGLLITLTMCNNFLNPVVSIKDFIIISDVSSSFTHQYFLHHVVYIPGLLELFLENK